MKNDTIVLGAGIVGTSIAVHLALSGRKVALIDRRAPGEETSYGNAGLVECGSLVPVAFPRSLPALLDVALKRNPAANYHWSALPGLALWLLAYWRASAPERLLAYTRAMAPLLAESVSEHRRLAREAGAEHYFRETGWLKLYRSEQGLAVERTEFDLAAQHGVTAREISREETLALEPDLQGPFRGAVLWSDPQSVSSPGGVTRAYADYFRRLGGAVHRVDARALAPIPGGWRAVTADGGVDGREAVVALGPWAQDLLRPLGVRVPMAVKRGYHMHYGARGQARLSRPVLDEEGGYVITPMEQGIRLTTGVEFARRDARKTPVQLARTEVLARQTFPLAERLDAEPWMGSRPAFPDMLPAIGQVASRPGLWLAIGHQHLGFTLGPVTGLLLRQMMDQQSPFADPAPFAPARFG